MHTHIPLFYAAKSLGVSLHLLARQLAYEPERKEKTAAFGVVIKGSLRWAQVCLC